MDNTKLSDFFSLVSQEKSENKARLKEQIESPQSDLGNLFKELEKALIETKKEPAISVEPESEPVIVKEEPEVEPVVELESIKEEVVDEEARLDAFSKSLKRFAKSDWGFSISFFSRVLF